MYGTYEALAPQCGEFTRVINKIKYLGQNWYNSLFIPSIPGLPALSLSIVEVTSCIVNGSFNVRAVLIWSGSTFSSLISS